MQQNCLNAYGFGSYTCKVLDMSTSVHFEIRLIRVSTQNQLNSLKNGRKGYQF